MRYEKRGLSRLNIFMLIVKNHSNDVIRRMNGIFSKVSGFVNENAKFFQ